MRRLSRSATSDVSTSVALIYPGAPSARDTVEYDRTNQGSSAARIAPELSTRSSSERRGGGQGRGRMLRGSRNEHNVSERKPSSDRRSRHLTSEPFCHRLCDAGDWVASPEVSATPESPAAVRSASALLAVRGACAGLFAPHVVLLPSDFQCTPALHRAHDTTHKHEDRRRSGDFAGERTQTSLGVSLEVNGQSPSLPFTTGSDLFGYSASCISSLSTDRIWAARIGLKTSLPSCSAVAAFE